MRDFFLLAVQNSLVANVILTFGLGLDEIPRGRGGLERSVREGMCLTLIITATVCLAVAVDVACLRPWGGEPARIGVLLFIGFFVSKAIHGLMRLPYRERWLSLSLAASLLATAREVWPGEGWGSLAGIGLGCFLVWILVAGIMERADISPIPLRLHPAPRYFIALGFLSVLFKGFQSIFWG